MQADESTAVLQFQVQTFKVLVGHVTPSSITVEYDAVGIFELRDVTRPAFGEVNLGIQGVSHVLVELVGEEKAPRPVFVLIVSVAAVTSHEDDFLFLVRAGRGVLVFIAEECRSGNGQQHDGKECGQCGFHC